MKKYLSLGILPIFTVIACAIFSVTAFSQKDVATPTAPTSVLLVEDFTYTPGSALTANGWTAHSAGGTNTIVTSSPSLSLTGYPGSGIGNAVALTTSGEDDNRTFPSQSSGSVYAAFLVNASDAAVDPIGGYFFHLGPDPVGTTFRGRVFIKKDASNNIAFGISKAATAAPDVAFTPFSYALNTTYLLVVKYTIVDGTSNDTVSLFVSTNVPASEPAATVSATDIATQTDISPGTVSLRQGTATTSPTVRVDGIRVGTSWADVTQAAVVPTQHVLDFDGDGKTDFAITRDSNGSKQWWVSLNSSGGSIATQWGVDSDQLAPADYDGDGKTDIAVWRPDAPNQAAFYILQSQTNTLRTELFGQTGDSPKVVRDYDGDGKADVSVYRAGLTPGSQSFFFYRGSLNNPSGNITYVPWGTSGDTVTQGDYDGDGKGDFCVRRNIGGAGWFIILKASGGVEYISWGLPTDAIVPCDFDGDAKSDLCVARVDGSNNFNTYVLTRAGGGTGASPIVFGRADLNDAAAFGDYDGDGKTDVGIWRPGASSMFWVRLTSSGNAIVRQWGLPGDNSVGEWNTTE